MASEKEPELKKRKIIDLLDPEVDLFLQNQVVESRKQTALLEQRLVMLERESLRVRDLLNLELAKCQKLCAQFEFDANGQPIVSS